MEQEEELDVEREKQCAQAAFQKNFILRIEVSEITPGGENIYEINNENNHQLNLQ